MSRKLNLVLPLIAGTALLAQTNPYERMLASKKEMMDYLESRARAVTARAFQETAASRDWEKLRAKRLDELRDMLGLNPWPARTPLRPVITGTLDQGDYIVEKVAFESMPKVYVTGDLYIPKKRAGKSPAVVYVCGHANSPYGAKVQYQRHGISFAKNGYVAFIIDPIQIAETFGLHHGQHSQEMFDWYSRGYSPGGVEAWNAIRAVDYLEARPEVDASRIGITGRSGGAATSWYAGALDPRIKVVVPVMGLGTYAEHVRNRTHSIHCDCMFPINEAGQDGIHQAALIAPRPILMGHGSQDRLFPGYKDVEHGLRTLYKSYDREPLFQSIVVDTGHADSDYLREKAIQWFDRYLMQQPDRKLDMAYTNAPVESLAVFPQGPPKDAQNYRLQEIFIPQAKLTEPKSRAAWEKHRTDLLTQLRSKVFGQMPTLTSGVKVERVTGQTDVPGGYEEWRITAPGFTPVRTVIRRPKKGAGPAPALLLVASDGESPRSANTLLNSVNARDTAVRMIVFPEGVGEVPWDHDFWKGATRHAMQVGETVDSIRLAGVLLAFEALRQDKSVDPAKVTVAGRGISGALGLYAAVLNERIWQVMLMEPPETHLNGPVFLNILRYTDIAEAAALVAPRHLVFYSRIPQAYTLTQRIYKTIGLPENISIAMQIEHVLEGRYDHNFGSGM